MPEGSFGEAVTFSGGFGEITAVLWYSLAFGIGAATFAIAPEPVVVTTLLIPRSDCSGGGGGFGFGFGGVPTVLLRASGNIGGGAFHPIPCGKEYIFAGFLSRSSSVQLIML